MIWDKEAVLRDLQQHPPAPPPINWQKFAREYDIPGANSGQVLKQFAESSSIDTFRLDGRASGTRQCMRKRRLYSGEISAPAPPTAGAVKDSWRKMVEKGELSLGVPCAPFTQSQHSIANGKLEKREITITSPSFHLKTSGRNSWQAKRAYRQMKSAQCQHKTYMIRCHSEMKICQIVKTSYVIDSRCFSVLARTLALWHDHATPLGLGIVMITVHVVFDPAVFSTQSERNDRSLNLQSTIESPSIYMLCISSSSAEDQAAFLQDRINCLNSLSDSIPTSNEVPIVDKLRFFVSDHLAKQFERGTL